MSSRDKAYQTYIEGFGLGLRPDPVLTVSEWADRYRMLPKRSSAEPGRWRTNRTPYLKEIMDCLSITSPVEQVKFMKGTQIGATEAGNNWFGYTAHICPAPMMMVLPTEEMAKKHSRQKITPTIAETPVLSERISEPKARDAGNTIMTKEFVGGIFILAGANSGASFRNVSIKNLFLDDVDGYPLGVAEEGDPLGLAKNRTDAYGHNAKIYIVSTPTNKGSSRIEQEYEDSDQRKHYVPCPHCNEKQVLMWSGIVFEHKNYNLQGDVKYRCISCGALFEEHHKTWMLEHGEWIPSNPGHPHRGYHLSSLYSPLGWLSWEKIVREFLKAKKHNDRELFKHWTNTRLAETWEEDAERVSDNALFNRREDYSKELLPESINILTSGVDIQGDRIEINVTGWGQHEESWAIEHKVLYGDTSKQEVWKHLDEFLRKPYQHFSGFSWSIKATCIDTGFRAKEVYDFVRPRQIMNVFAVKGSNERGVPIVSKPSKNIPGIYLYHIGTDTAKDTIFGRLKIAEPGAGYMHFSKEFDEEYFKQLTAESKQTKHRRGFAFTEWVKKDHQRNEALDMTVYAIAALYIIMGKSYPNNTVSQALERLSERYAAEVNQKQNNVPMPQQHHRQRRMVSKVDIYS